MLDLRTRPTAIFAVNDTAAIGVMGALRERGLRPGEDVAVVGYNDIPIAADLPVPLTSVHAPMFEMGSEALALLLDRVQGRPVRSRRLRPELVAAPRHSATTPRQAPTAPEHDPDISLSLCASRARTVEHVIPHHIRESP